MNKIWVGCFLSSLFTPLANAQAPLTLEERLAQMEQRLQETEQRATSAEAEIRALKRQEKPAVAASNAAAKPALQVNDYGELKFYGDVEFNMDGASRTGSLTSVRTSANKNWAPGKKSAGILTDVFFSVLMACGKGPMASMPALAYSRWRI